MTACRVGTDHDTRMVGLMTLIDDLRMVRDAADAAIRKHRYADLNLDDREAIRDVLRRDGRWLFVWQYKVCCGREGDGLSYPWCAIG